MTPTPNNEALAAIEHLRNEMNDPTKEAAELSGILSGMTEHGYADLDTLYTTDLPDGDGFVRRASELLLILVDRIHDLETELDAKDSELLDALSEPWPEWAKQVLKMTRELSGYDGYDDSDGIDIAEEVKEAYGELTSQIERLRGALASSGQGTPAAPAQPRETQAQAGGVREADDAYGLLIKALAAMVNCPQTDEQFAADVLPRDPIMSQVHRAAEAARLMMKAARALCALSTPPAPRAPSIEPVGGGVKHGANGAAL